MKRYVFDYVPESTRRGIVHRPVVLVHLRSMDGSWLAFRVYADSGADISLFTKGDSKLLGLNLYEGEYRPIVGVGKILIPAYVHRVGMMIGEAVFEADVAFAESDEVPRVLGRADVFKRFRVTFDEANLRTIFEASVEG